MDSDCMAMPRQLSLALSEGEEPENVLANTYEIEKLVQHKIDVENGSKRVEDLKVLKPAKPMPKAGDAQKKRSRGKEREPDTEKMPNLAATTTPEKPLREQKRRGTDNQPRKPIERSRNVQGGILRAFLRQCAKEMHKCNQDSQKNASKIRNVALSNDKLRYLHKKQGDQLRFLLKRQKRIEKRIRQIQRCIFNYE